MSSEVALTGLTPAKQERLVQLETDLRLKKKELADIQADIASMEAKRPSETADYLNQLLKDRKLLQAVPLAQVGNTIAMFKARTEEERQAYHALEKVVQELQLQIKQSGDRTVSTARNTESIKIKTGFTTSALALSAKVKAPEVTPKEIEDEIEKVKVRVSTARVLRDRRSAALSKLHAELEARKESYDRLQETLNTILVEERKIQEKKEELRELLVAHSQLDLDIKAANDRVDHTSKALLELDIDAYKRQSAEIIEQRRTEDRILKAQEARILLLDDRLAMVQEVLREHGLEKEVAQIALQMQFASRDAQPTDDEAIDHYCRIDVLAPEHEMVASSILALFNHDLQAREKRIRTKRMMAEEKSDARTALSAKVRDLKKIHEEATDRVHDLKSRNEFQVDEKVKEAREKIAERKAEYDTLLLRNAELSAQIGVLENKRAKEREEQKKNQAADEAAKKSKRQKKDDGVQSGW